MRNLLLLGALALAVSVAWAADNKPISATNQVAQPIELPGLYNAFRATEKIYSGSQPESDEAFAALAKLGVKTIISVDGSKPDVETARKHGLRYIHLPFGYDGVPTNRVAELTKVATAETGPFFIHCHHGKHRGPAAIAVMCEASASWTPGQAEAWLREAGTSADYPGLYRAAREFKMPTPAELTAVKELPEIAKSSSVVDAMVAIDAHLDALKLSQQAGWITPPGHADITPAHEATMLWEQFRELARTEDTARRPADYQTKLNESEQSTDSLRQLLREPQDRISLDATLKQVGQSCATCHKKYRNQ